MALASDSAEQPEVEVELTDGELSAQIGSILAEKDLTQTSLKEARSEIEKRLNLSPGSLDGKKEQVKLLVAAHVQRQALQALQQLI
eukprot:g6496.t1